MSPEFVNEPLHPDQPEVFSRYLPGAFIELVQPNNIPTVIMGRLEKLSKRVEFPDECNPTHFDALYLITHKDGSRTVAARQKILHVDFTADGERWTLEEITQFLDIGNGDQFLGRSELSMYYEEDSFFKDKPFEASSRTEESYRRNGFALRRTLILNAFSQMLYGLPLYSSEHFIHRPGLDGKEIQPQKLVWEKLVQMDLATKFQEESAENADRYVFNQ